MQKKGTEMVKDAPEEFFKRVFDEVGYETFKEAVLKALNASTKVPGEIQCKFCRKRQIVYLDAPDPKKRIETFDLIYSRVVGKPKEAPVVQQPVSEAVDLESLSDEELGRIAAG